MSFETDPPVNIGRPAAEEFRLTRWFLVLSFVCIFATSSASALFLSNFLSENMLRRDAVVSMELVNSIVASGDLDLEFESGGATREPRALTALFSQVESIPDVLRANIYAPDRSIVWSSNPALIGVEFSTNPELDQAMSGELVVSRGTIGEVEKAEHAFLEGVGSTFIENYLPIRDSQTAKVIGVIEVYKSPTAVFSAIDRGKRLVWASAILGGIVLYFCLFWIIRRASIVMERQQKRLVETEILAAVGEMSMAVAHGLRNPLASIRSSAELSLDENLSNELRESLTDIVVQSDRMERWVGELLNSARPVTVELEQLQINDVLTESTDAASADLERRKIELVVSFTHPLPPVLGSEGSLRQVFNSLLANAADAMPDGGVLRVESNFSRDRRQIAVTIRDTGHGISEQNLDKVFRPFMSTKGKGLGVGLSLAKQIIERHHGSLEIVESTENGTVVEVRIPVAE